MVPTRVTINMAEVALVLSIAFFIRIVVTLMRKDVIIARIAAGTRYASDVEVYCVDWVEWVIKLIELNKLTELIACRL